MFDFDELEEQEPVEQKGKSPPAAVSKVQRGPPRPLGRKLRVLALHGGGSNTNIMMYQVGPLKRLLGDKAEWDFLNGATTWEGEPANDMMKALAKGMPFHGWYRVENDDQSDRPYNDKLFDLSVKFTYGHVEKAVDSVLEHIAQHGPFDVLLGFSQGCIVTTLITGMLREKGEEPSWRLNVLFNGMRVRDNRYAQLFETPLSQPSVMVFGRLDEFYGYGRQSQAAIYEDPVIFEHEEGHKFPSQNPAGKEIYNQVAEKILWHCGAS